MRILNIAVLIFASCIAAKNVYYLDNLVSALKNGNNKRDARNVVSLESFHAAIEEEDKKLAGDTQATEKRSNKRSQGVIKPDEPLLQTLLPQVPGISIFSAYLRDNAEISSRVDDSEGFTVIFAPSDDAVLKFSSQKGLKPWEYPNHVQNDETDDKVAQKNIQYFIDAHISSSAAEKDNLMVVELRNGQYVTIGQDESTAKFFIRQGDSKFAVSSVEHASNGILLVLDHVLIK